MRRRPAFRQPPQAGRKELNQISHCGFGVRGIAFLVCQGGELATARIDEVESPGREVAAKAPSQALPEERVRAAPCAA